MDMQKTIDALVVASHLSPLSIVIIGVDPADFSSMVALDGDGGKLRASNGQESARDIVQFVPYNRFSGYPDALARETLAEIPNQLCQFMKVRGATPNPALPPTYRLFSEPSGSETRAPPPSSSQPSPAAVSLQAQQQHLAQGASHEQYAPTGYPAQAGHQQGGYRPQQGHTTQEPSHEGYPSQGYPVQSHTTQGPSQGYQNQGGYPFQSYTAHGYPAQGAVQGYQQGGHLPQQGYSAESPSRGAAPGYPGYRG